MILMTGWHGETDFIDPMCGSGTLLIEAALIAQNMAPGVFRKEYAFEKWPDFDRELFDEIYNDDSEERPFNHKIKGYDIDIKAVNTAKINIRAAGLTKVIDVECADFKEFTQPQEKAIIVCNPPYGERLLEIKEAEQLYRTMGKVFPADPDKKYYVISPHEEFEHIFGRTADRRRKLYNGMIKCQLFMYFR